MARINLIHIHVFPNTLEDGVDEYEQGIRKRDLVYSINAESWENVDVEIIDNEDIYYRVHLEYDELREFLQQIVIYGYQENISLICYDESDDRLMALYGKGIDFTPSVEYSRW